MYEIDQSVPQSPQRRDEQDTASEPAAQSMSSSFSSHADEWDHLLTCQVDLFARKEFEVLRALPDWNAAQRVLDVGCGNGDYTVLLSKTFPTISVFGFDTSPELINSAKARHKYNSAQFLSGSMNEVGLVFDPDTVLMRFVVQHVPDPTALFEELAAVFPKLDRIVLLEINLPQSRHSPLIPGLVKLMEAHENLGDANGNLTRSALGNADTIASIIGKKWRIGGHRMVVNQLREHSWQPQSIASLLSGWASALSLSARSASNNNLSAEIQTWVNNKDAELTVAMDCWVIDRTAT